MALAAQLSEEQLAFLEGRISASDGVTKLESAKNEKHTIWSNLDAKLAAVTKYKDALDLQARPHVRKLIESKSVEIQKDSERIVSAAVGELLDGKELIFRGAELLEGAERELVLLRVALMEIESLERKTNKIFLEVKRDWETSKGDFADAKADLLSFHLLMSLAPAMRQNGALTFDFNNVGEVGGLRQAARFARREAAAASRTLDEILRGEQNS
jgi:hypothetical protein